MLARLGAALIGTSFLRQPTLGERRKGEGLGVAQPGPSADGIVHPDKQISQLVQLTRALRLVTVGYVAAFGFQVADPLAQHPVVPPVVASGAEVEAGGAAGCDGQWAFGPVGVDQGDRSVPESPFVILEVPVLFDRENPMTFRVP